MSNAKLTMFGYNSYFSSLGKSLFDNLTLPEGITRDTLIDNILLRGGEFEVLYGNPEFMRRAIGAWSLKWRPTFERWINALSLEYDPLENYDRIEDWTDNVERSEAMSGNQTHSRNLESSQVNSEDGSFSQSDAKHTDSETNTQMDKSAYDSNQYQPQTKETAAGDSNESSASSSQSKNSGSSINSETGSESTKDDQSSAMNNDAVHSGRIHGNIGVTTSQQMLLSELELGYWNIYEKITELFLQEFTIPVYI